MNGKVFGIFTGTHLTVLAGIAMLVPGALYGADAFTRVVIQDGQGHLAFITGGKLNVYDQVGDTLAGYASNPANFVKAYASCTSSTTNSTIYTVPSGKALILKSANFTFYSGASGSDNYAYLFADNQFSAGIESGDVAADHSADFGTGISATTSLVVSCSPGGATYLTTITGYLVPSSVAPMMAVAARSGPQIVKGGKTL